METYTQEIIKRDKLIKRGHENKSLFVKIKFTKSDLW
jgi:hypothetical protein